MLKTKQILFALMHREDAWQIFPVFIYAAILYNDRASPYFSI